jgi:voltage-gated potassium channel
MTTLTLGMVGSARQRCFDVIFDGPGSDEHHGHRIFDACMLTLISLNVLVVILETEPTLWAQYAHFFLAFDAVSVAIFGVEYLLRLWDCTLDPRYMHPIWGRVRYALTPFALIDLFAVLPFFIPFVAVDLRFLRSVRLFRLFRVLKLGRYSQSLGSLAGVLKSKKEQLLVAAFSGFILVIIASSLIYLAEREAQPEAFGSIPSAMWWAVVTLTTVGYGDIYPKTVLGKMIASAISILGIGMLALPAGILASGFAERIAHKPRQARVCPHCGKTIPEEHE